MAADVAADDDSIARFGQGPRSLNTVHDLTDTGRRNEEVIDLSLPGHLSVTGNNADAGFSSRFSHSLGVGFDFFHGEAFFNDEGTR